MIQKDSRKTKVISSFHGSSLSRELANAVRDEELDVLRIVYEPADAKATSEFFKELGSKHAATIMLDISRASQGQVVAKKTVEFEFGASTTISSVSGAGEIQMETSGKINKIFAEGADVFIGYGRACFRVVSVEKDLARLEVTQGGPVNPNMDVVVPSTRGNKESVSCDKIMDILAAVDFLVISGQHPPTEIMQLRAEIQNEIGDLAPWILAKVDTVGVYERLGELLPVIDGLMISRREIAITTDPATVPMITKEIIQRCNDRARIVVTASEMLASMRYNVTPTRAEVSDIANAIIDGTDAIIISEQVSEGPYRKEALSVIGRIIQDIEHHDSPLNWVKFEPMISNEMDAITYHAYRTAERIGAKAVVCLTKEGNTALRLSSHRVPMPIIAVTFSRPVLKRLGLVRGVQSVVVDVDPNLDEVLPVVSQGLLRDSWLKTGDSIIFVAVSLSPVGLDSSNLFTVQTLQ